MSSPPMVIARTDLRRSIRIVFASPTKVLTLGILAVVGVGPLLLGVGIGAFAVGRAIEEGLVADVGNEEFAHTVGGVVAIGWLGLWGLSILRAATQTGTLDLPDVLLLGTSLRNVVLGVLAGETIRFALFIVPLAALIGAPMAIGAGQPWIAAIVPVLAGLLLLSAIPAGYPVGVAIRHLMTTYRPIARLRVPIVVALLAAYAGLLVTERFEPALTWLIDMLADSPLAWPGELFLVVVAGVAAEPWPIVAALGLTPLVVALCMEASERVATVHWFRDPGRPTQRSVRPILSLGPLERALAGRVDRPVLAICLTTLRRTKRAPIRVLYVSYPLLGSVFFIAEIVRRGEVPLLLFVLLGTYVVWGAGALVTLNPLGDLGPVVETVASSPVPGRQVMRGYRLAAWLVGLPAAAVVVAAAAIVGDVTRLEIGLLALGIAVATLLSPMLALGVGATFPRFGSVRVTNRREAVMPGKLAFSIYTSFVSVPAGAAVVLSSPWFVGLLTAIAEHGLGYVGPEAADASLWAVRLFLLIPALLSVPLALMAYRIACYQYDGYHLP